MKIDVSEWIWLNDQGTCSAQHLIEISGLTHEELDVLVDNDIIVPVDKQANQRSFHLHYLATARTARRLRDDFELDQNGLTLALTLIGRIDELRQQLNAARGRFNPDTSE